MPLGQSDLALGTGCQLSPTAHPDLVLQPLSVTRGTKQGEAGHVDNGTQDWVLCSFPPWAPTLCELTYLSFPLLLAVCLC